MDNQDVLVKLARQQRLAAYFLSYSLLMIVYNFLFVVSYVAGPPWWRSATAEFTFEINASLIYILWLPLIIFINLLVPHATAPRSSDRLIVRISSCFPFLQLIAAVGLIRRLNKRWRQQGLSVSWLGPSPRLVATTDLKDACFGCGYDLRGNVSGVCPECGSSVEATG